MLGTVMRNSSLGLSMCHNLMSSLEQVANNSDVPLAEKQIGERHKMKVKRMSETIQLKKRIKMMV